MLTCAMKNGRQKIKAFYPPLSHSTPLPTFIFPTNVCIRLSIAWRCFSAVCLFGTYGHKTTNAVPNNEIMRAYTSEKMPW